MYAKVDVDGLVKEFPDLKPGVDEMRAGLTSADPSAGVPESVRGPATALLDGSWVSLDLQAWLDQLTAMAAGDGVDAAGTGLDSQASKKARDLAGTILSKALTTVERRETDDRLGDHLVAKVNLQEAYRQLRAGIPDVFSGSPKAEQMEGSLPPVASVPDKDIAISIWVRDTALTRLELDAAQFLDKPAGHLVLRADLLPAEKITAPTGAVPFDVDALVADLPAALGAGSSDPGSAMAGDIDAYTVATWVDEDIRAEADDNAIPPTPDVLDRVLQYYTDVAPGLLIFHVDQRIQVNLGGQSACLTLSGDVEQEGTVADGPC
jgi:hypothetical protein